MAWMYKNLQGTETMTFGKHGLLLSTALIAGLIYGGTASAQSNNDEIIVTAQKRQSTLLDTPIAMSAVTAESLDKSQIRDIKDLQSLVPSLTVPQFANPSAATLTIRGIGTSGFNAGLEPSVGVFIDGVYRARAGSALSDLFDVERVEVLRGPQSLIYGKNTPAGVISVITKKPEFEYGLNAEATIGNYNSRIFKGSVTGPISDKVAFRIAGTKNDRNGFIENVANGTRVNDRNRYGLKAQILAEPRDDISIRLIADINQINEHCCAAPFVYNLPQNAGAFTLLGANILPARPFDRKVAFDGKVQTENTSSGLSAEVNVAFKNFDLTSLTAYRHFNEIGDIDADFVDVEAVRRRTLGDSWDTITQEIRLTSTGEHMVDWMVGGYYFTQNKTHSNVTQFGPTLRQFADLATSGLISGLEGILGATRGVAPGTLLQSDTGLDGQFRQDSSSYATFAKLDFHATEQLTVSGGIRYTKENKDASANISSDMYSQFKFVPGVAGPDNDFIDVSFETGLLIDAVTAQQAAAAAPGIQADPTSPLFGAPIPVIIQAITPTVRSQVGPAIIGGLRAFQFFPTQNLQFADKISEDNVSGNITLSYDVSKTLNVYASYNRGFKAGGFNLSNGSRAGSRNFKNEDIDSYEIGLKTRLFDNRVRLAIAGFDQSLKNFQSEIFNGATFDVNNAGNVSIRGVEVDILAKPIDAFTWTFDATYLDHKYDKFDRGPCTVAERRDPSSGSCFTNGYQDFAGRKIAGVSDWTVSTTGTYTHPIGEHFEGFVRGELRYRSGFNPKADLNPLGEQDSSYIVSASAGISNMEQGWDLSVWGRNLTDEHVLQGVFDSVGQPGSLNGYPINPTTYGVTLRISR